MARVKADSIEKRQDEFLRCFREKRGRIAHACLLANVTPAQVKGWVERDPVFEEKYEDMRQLVLDDKREVRDELAYVDKDRAMLTMDLKTLPEHTDRKEVHVSGQVNHAHAHLALENISKEDRERILAEGARLIQSGEV